MTVEYIQIIILLQREPKISWTIPAQPRNPYISNQNDNTLLLEKVGLRNTSADLSVLIENIVTFVKGLTTTMKKGRIVISIAIPLLYLCCNLWIFFLLDHILRLILLIFLNFFFFFFYTNSDPYDILLKNLKTSQSTTGSAFINIPYFGKNVYFPFSDLCIFLNYLESCFLSNFSCLHLHFVTESGFQKN